MSGLLSCRRLVVFRGDHLLGRYTSPGRDRKLGWARRASARCPQLESSALAGPSDRRRMSVRPGEGDAHAWLVQNEDEELAARPFGASAKVPGTVTGQVLRPPRASYKCPLIRGGPSDCELSGSGWRSPLRPLRSATGAGSSWGVGRATRKPGPMRSPSPLANLVRLTRPVTL